MTSHQKADIFNNAFTYVNKKYKINRKLSNLQCKTPFWLYLVSRLIFFGYLRRKFIVYMKRGSRSNDEQGKHFAKTYDIPWFKSV